MKTLYIILIVVLSLALIIFTVLKNNKDRKKFERQVEEDFKKPPVED